MKKKILITMSVEVLKALDEWAKNKDIPRSTAISLILREALKHEAKINT